MSLSTILIIAGLLGAILGVKKPWKGGITGLLIAPPLFYFYISSNTILLFIITMTIIKRTGIGFLLLISIVGCMGTYGKIRKQTADGGKVTLAELSENWDDYDVFYGMRSGRRASALIFDPKENGTSLTGTSWIKVEDRKTLNMKIDEINMQYKYATVNIIEGPDNQAFGFIYYPSYLHLPVKVVDERTMHVSTLPPYKSTP